MHVLTGDAGIKAAAETAAGLRSALKDHKRVCIDTQALTAADITTVQTLLAARVSAQAQGKTLLMAAPLGGPLQDVLRDAGFLSPGQSHSLFWAHPSDQP